MAESIHLSVRESEIMNLRIGRAALHAIDPPALLSEVAEGGYDLVKLTVPAEMPDLYHKLDHLGIPYYIVGIINHYRYDCVHHKHRDYYHDNLVFEPYDSTLQQEQLRQIARSIFRESPGSYFENPWLRNLVTHEMYLTSFEEYVLSFDQKSDPHKLTYFVKHNNRYVGFLSLTNKDRESDAAYAGVIPDRRGTGYYLDMIRFIHNWGHEAGLKWGHGYVQLQNIVVQRFYHRTEMMIYDNHLSIHLNAFLSQGRENVCQVDLPVDGRADFANHVLQQCSQILPHWRLKTSHVAALSKPDDGEGCRLSVTTPAVSATQAFVVAKIISARNRLLEVHYLEFAKIS